LHPSNQDHNFQDFAPLSIFVLPNLSQIYYWLLVSNGQKVKSNCFVIIFVFGWTNIIHIRIRSFSEGRILFVFVSSLFWNTEYYSYSYSVIFGRSNNICICIWSSKHYSLTLIKL
jgi:hypothetical protein